MKCISGHYGELLARDRRHKIEVLFSPMIYSLPSYLNGHVAASPARPRVMAAPENIKAGFLKGKDVFAEHGGRHVAPACAMCSPGSTKPAGSVKIRVETIAHYLQKHCADIVAKKKAAAPAGCPLLDRRQINGVETTVLDAVHAGLISSWPHSCHKTG